MPTETILSHDVVVFLMLYFRAHRLTPFQVQALSAKVVTSLGIVHVNAMTIAFTRNGILLDFPKKTLAVGAEWLDSHVKM